MSILGAVLAGGRSRRYGRDKALELVAGEPMLLRAIRVLKATTEDVVVISSKPAAVPDGISVLPDVRPGHGPLGGLHTALREADRRRMDAVLLLACDLPLVNASVLAAIAAQAGASLAAAPKRSGGIEPLCALYSRAALPLVEQRLDGADLSLHALFRALHGRELDLTSLGLDLATSFLNVNTPEDLERAESEMDHEERA